MGKILTKQIEQAKAAIANSYMPLRSTLLNKLETIVRKDEQEKLQEEMSYYKEIEAVEKMFWKRLLKWNEEWQKEKPKERKLCHHDAKRLIEWKLEKAYLEGLAGVQGRTYADDD